MLRIVTRIKLHDIYMIGGFAKYFSHLFEPQLRKNWAGWFSGYNRGLTMPKSARPRESIPPEADQNILNSFFIRE